MKQSISQKVKQGKQVIKGKYNLYNELYFAADEKLDIFIFVNGFGYVQITYDSIISSVACMESDWEYFVEYEQRNIYIMLNEN